MSKEDLRQRLKDRFNEQVDFIRASCERYDNGTESEAIRIATSLRTLFHDSRGKGQPSISLMSHLGLRAGKILSSSRGHGNQDDYLAYSFSFDQSVPAKRVPLLGDKFHEIQISKWWDGETILVHEANPIPRRKLVLDITNKDGGAHVDEALPKYYDSLTRGDERIGMKIEGLSEIVGPIAFEEGVTHYATNAHYALIRQFAHEFLSSVERFQWPAKSD